jgi:UDP-N-acetylglucosamine:LPS N-acetylglucosamine transferase
MTIAESLYIPIVMIIIPYSIEFLNNHQFHKH